MKKAKKGSMALPARLRAGLFSMAVALGLSACGGGSSQESAQQAELVLSTPEASLPSGSRQLQSLELRNLGKASASQVVISVTPDAKLLQLALSCIGEAAVRCKPRADGGIEIAELRAGELITLEQVLRLEPGFSGPVGAQWSLSHAGATAPLSQRQSLQADAADVAVAIAAPQASTKDGQAVLSYEVTLSNLGPDEAKDVDWRLMPAPGMRWLGATCAASGGAQCPGTLAEVMSVGRVPKGAELRLRVDYAARASRRADSDFLASEALAAGDLDGRNNRVVSAKGADLLGNYMVAVGLDGRSYEMTYSDLGDLGLRIRGNGVSREERVLVDVTGAIWISRDGNTQLSDVSTMGSLNGRSGLRLGAYDFGKGRQPFLAGGSFVQDLKTLAGRDFNILASWRYGSGQPSSGNAWAGRFEGSSFLLCQSAQPTPLTQCKAAELRRYAAAVIGTEIELLSGTEVLRMHAFQTDQGPSLFMAMKDPVAHVEQVWIGLPAVELPYRYASMYGIGESDLRSPAGISDMLMLDSSPASNGEMHVGGPSIGLPENYFRWRYPPGQCVLVEVNGHLPTTPLKGMYLGQIDLSLCGAKTESGNMFHIQGAGLVAMLGTTGSPVAGRWVFAVPALFGY